MARAWAAVRPIVSGCFTGGLIGVTISDRYATRVTVDGKSMYPTFDPKPTEHLLVEKLCVDRYTFSRGDVVTLRSPSDHRVVIAKRLIALPGDWIQVPEKQEILRIPEGHCWVEGDNASISLDSREFGPLCSNYLEKEMVTGDPLLSLASNSRQRAINISTPA